MKIETPVTVDDQVRLFDAVLHAFGRNCDNMTPATIDVLIADLRRMRTAPPPLPAELAVPEGVDTAELPSGVQMGNLGEHLYSTAQVRELMAQQRGAGRREESDAHMETIRQRDRYQEIADKLADGVSEHFGEEIGEHSSGNCPWQNALELLNTKPEFMKCEGHLHALTTRQPVAPELTDEHQHADLIHELRQFAQAYPEDIFTPLTDAEREGNDLIITKASAGMGRHCAKWFIKGADALESTSPVAPVSQDLATQLQVAKVLPPVSALTDEQITAATEATKTLTHWIGLIKEGSPVGTITLGYILTAMGSLKSALNLPYGDEQ